MDHYKILGVKKNATSEEIRTAYKDLAKRFHPDVYQGDKVYAETMMQDINTAYETLSNPYKKELYDISYPNERIRHTDKSRNAPKVKKTSDQKPQVKREHDQTPGVVETWNSSPGIAALAISLSAWLLYIAFQSAIMNLLMFVAFPIFSVIAIFLMIKVRIDIKVDIFALSWVYTIIFILIYYVFSFFFLTGESMDLTAHILFCPLAAVISLFPATITINIIQKLRKNKSRR